MAWEKAAAAAGLLFLLWRLVSSKNFQLSCHTDYATELVCRWETDATINCTKEFRLHYRTRFTELFRECVPENEAGPGPASHCACIIPGEEFKHVTYHLLLFKTDNNTEVWRVSQEMDSVAVKPRPLVNLTVEKRKDHTFILTWTRDYRQDNSLYTAVANYEVGYWPKTKREMNTVFPESSSYHEIFADNLISGATYEASVRYKLELWGETWSEWSPLCEWLNDFEPKPSKESWTFIPWLCISVIALILISYLSFLWGKRKWWDWVPSPAKSKLAEQMVANRLFSVAGKISLAAEQASLPCDSCKLSQREFQSQDWGDLPPRPPEVSEELFLIPEVPLVKGSLRIYSSSSSADVGLDDPEESASVPHEGAMASLFRDLLDGVLKVGETRSPGQSQAAPEPSPESCSSSASQDCVEKPADGEDSGPGQGLPIFEAQGSSLLPRPEKSLVGPLAEDQPVALSSGYKSFSSLGAQTRSSFSQVKEPWPSFPQGSQTQPPGNTGPGVFPGEVSCTLDGAASVMWVLPSLPGMIPEASAKGDFEGLGDLCFPGAPFSSGYRSFSYTHQSSPTSQGFCNKGMLGLASPYKPFLISVPQDSAMESPANRDPLDPGLEGAWGPCQSSLTSRSGENPSI